MNMVPNALGGGRYELAGLLGHGGMAEVRQAHDVRLGRTVAIKRLRTDLASDPTFQARFRREAQSAASLNHPAIVAVYDTGEEPASDGSGLMLPYIVMEYVEGRTLRDILREGRKILPERALEITSSVLTALDYSHRAGIIYRDIKPANVMLTPTGDVKVMDFGISRALADSSVTMTQTAAVIGTAQYLSPEQARGEQVDARSDIYSAGCLLYELLTGRPPFIGDSPISVAYQHVREEPTPPSTLDPEIPPEVDAITLKALCKSVDDRYQSAMEMRTDIERALEGKQVMAPPIVGATELETQHLLAQPPLQPAATSVNPAVATAYDDEPRRSRAGLWAVLGLLIAALAIGGLVVIPQLFADDTPNQVEVPNVQRLTVAQAQQKLGDAGLELGEQKRGFSTSISPGRIIYQSESPGDLVDTGTAVDVTISAGAEPVTIPLDIADMGLDEATAELEGLGLNVNPQPDEQSTERKNQVTSTKPGPGIEVEAGSDVTVFYSTGFVSVPSVIGFRQPRAEATLRRFGFEPVASDTVSDQPEGTVTAQTPEAGSKQARGATVVFEVSLGPAEPTVTATTTAATTTSPTTSETTTTEPTTEPTTPPTSSPATKTTATTPSRSPSTTTTASTTAATTTATTTKSP